MVHLYTEVVSLLVPVQLALGEGGGGEVTRKRGGNVNRKREGGEVREDGGER